MNVYDKAFEKYFKTKNEGTFTSKGIWVIKIHLAEIYGWEWNAKDFEVLCANIDLSKWYQLRDLSDLEVLKTRRLNQDKEMLKVMKSSIAING